MNNSNVAMDSAVFTLSSDDGGAPIEVHFALPVDSRKGIKILSSRPTASTLQAEGVHAISDEARLRTAVEFLHAHPRIFKVPMTEFFDANTGVRVMRMASYSSTGPESALVGIDYSVEIDGECYSVAMVQSQDLAHAIARAEIIRIFRSVEPRSNLATTLGPRF